MSVSLLLHKLKNISYFFSFLMSKDGLEIYLESFNECADNVFYLIFGYIKNCKNTKGLLLVLL